MALRDADAWAFCTPRLQGISYRFAVRTDDEVLGRHLDTLLAGLRAADPDDAAEVDHWYALTTTASGNGHRLVDVTRDDEVVARAQRRADAVGWVVWDVNRSTADASGSHLLFHAGGVEVARTGVLIPGTSGSGKSTLVAGLACAGAAYLSDELVGLDMTNGRLLPYAKPITLKQGSFDALRGLGPPRIGEGGADDELWRGDEWQVVVGAGSGIALGKSCRPGFMVVPTYIEGADTSLVPLAETEAFFALAVNAVNLIAHGSRGTEALGRLVGRCICARLIYSDLERACELVRELVDDPSTLHRHHG